MWLTWLPNSPPLRCECNTQCQNVRVLPMVNMEKECTICALMLSLRADYFLFRNCMGKKISWKAGSMAYGAECEQNECIVL